MRKGPVLARSYDALSHVPSDTTPEAAANIAKGERHVSAPEPYPSPAVPLPLTPRCNRTYFR